MTAHIYGTSAADFHPGDRVELHPVLDEWMAGLRFGTVMDTTDTGHVLVHLDGRDFQPRSRRDRFNPRVLRIVGDPPIPEEELIDEFYTCGHCDFASDSEGSAANHYYTAHPDIDDEEL